MKLASKAWSSTLSPRASRLVLGSLFIGSLSGCLPHQLKKYQGLQSSGSTALEPRAVQNTLTEKKLTGPVEEPALGFRERSAKAEVESRIGTGQGLSSDGVLSGRLGAPRDHSSNGASQQNHAMATIYQVDRNTYHFKVSEADVWETVLDVLLRNYSLAIVDRNSGVLATDWDSYYLGKAVYRNKLSFRVKKSNLSRQEGGPGVDLVVHNSVEKLSDLSTGALGLASVWLPSKDPIQEVNRVVQNMSILLKQPPPVTMTIPEQSVLSKAGGGLSVDGAAWSQPSKAD